MPSSARAPNNPPRPKAAIDPLNEAAPALKTSVTNTGQKVMSGLHSEAVMNTVSRAPRSTGSLRITPSPEKACLRGPTFCGRPCGNTHNATRMKGR